MAAVFGSLGLAALYAALADGQMGVVAPIRGVLTAAIPVAVGIAMAGIPGPVRLAGFGLAIVAVLLVSAGEDGTAGRGGILLAWGGGRLRRLHHRIGQVQAGIFVSLVVSRATATGLVLLIVRVSRDPGRAPCGGGRGWSGSSCWSAAWTWAATRRSCGGAGGGLELAAMLGSLYPVATVVLAAIILREPIGRVHVTGIGAAALAAMLIVGGA